MAKPADFVKPGDRVKVEMVVTEVTHSYVYLETYEPEGAEPQKLSIPRRQVRQFTRP